MRETGTRFSENPLEDPGVPNDLEGELNDYILGRIGLTIFMSLEFKDTEPSKSKVTASRNSSESKVDAITQTEKIPEFREVHEPKGIPGPNKIVKVMEIPRLKEKLDIGEGPDNRQRYNSKKRSNVEKHSDAKELYHSKEMPGHAAGSILKKSGIDTLDSGSFVLYTETNCRELTHKQSSSIQILLNPSQPDTQ